MKFLKFNAVVYEVCTIFLPPSDEGDGKTVGFGGGREKREYIKSLPPFRIRSTPPSSEGGKGLYNPKASPSVGKLCRHTVPFLIHFSGRCSFLAAARSRTQGGEAWVCTFLYGRVAPSNIYAV